MDGHLVKNFFMPHPLRQKIDISIQKHDCAGHPVDEVIHREHVEKSVIKIKKYHPECSVAGVWILENWEAERII